MERFLSDADGVRGPGYSDVQKTCHDNLYSTAALDAFPTTDGNKTSLTSPTLSHSSTISSSSSQSDVSSLRSSLSSGTSASQIPRTNPLLNLDEQIANMSLDYNYDLPCEFHFIGCNVRFHPENFEAWYSHTTSHFLHHEPPPYSICVFCDEGNACFRADEDNDRYTTWRNRLLHITGHLADGKTLEDVRPDYFLIDYMRNLGLVTQHDYACAVSFTERPFCIGLVPLGYETDEMKRRKARWEPEDNPPEVRREGRRHRRNVPSGRSRH